MNRPPPWCRCGARPMNYGADLFAILEEVEKRTGAPSVINTSFNIHEEPIVCSPADAIRAFHDGRLDYLALESFLVEPHE